MATTKPSRRGIGPKPKDRKLIKQPKPGKKLTANQWANTPQQNIFMEAWLEPSSPTFSNAYRSALAAGYSPKYANQIVSRDTGNDWIREYVRASFMGSDHIVKAFQDMYLNPKSYNNSRSPGDTRLKALELLSKITGLLDGNQQTNITIVQPILGGASSTEAPKHVDVD